MDQEELEICLRVLADLADVPCDDPNADRVRRAAGAFLKRRRGRERKQERRLRSAADAALLAATATGAADRRDGAPVDVPTPAVRVPADVPTPAVPVPWVGDPIAGLRSCYVCGMRFRDIDAFYHRLCRPCAQENQRRRHARSDLTGRRALVTGGRVKAGFELVLKLLRDGAEVTALTRFPVDALRRFSAVADHDRWAHRLTVTGLDLRDIPALVRWCEEEITSSPHLDILVNLAAQTVRLPPESYAALLAGERAAGAVGGVTREVAGGFAAELTSGFEGAAAIGTPRAVDLPLGAVDVALGAVDIAGLLPDPSPVNSWTHLVHEVDPVELLEVQLINVTAPFLLLSRLRPLLERSPHPRRYVVNVSAVEGQFARRYKGAEHPHTNMAKAALNMLTLTGAGELAAHGIYMTSVDPGWFTDQQPAPDRHRRAAAGFRPPLDVVDAAARVYDPIVRGEQGDPPYGCFLKNYQIAPW